MEHLRCVVERITYQNADNGYTVLKCAVKNYSCLLYTSYTKVIDYFNPKLFLGMTATPDKRDDNQEGKNIYEIFHYQIAHEIRLQQAMENNLLCPFHYRCV